MSTQPDRVTRRIASLVLAFATTSASLLGVDAALAKAWRQFQLPANSALIGVGGYGRGELLPSSDIDILILHDGAALEGARKSLESLTAFFWDIGLEVGSSVRSLDECVSEAAKDITVITNLMEARALYRAR